MLWLWFSTWDVRAGATVIVSFSTLVSSVLSTLHGVQWTHKAHCQTDRTYVPVRRVMEMGEKDKLLLVTFLKSTHAGNLQKVHEKWVLWDNYAWVSNFLHQHKLPSQFHFSWIFWSNLIGCMVLKKLLFTHPVCDRENYLFPRLALTAATTRGMLGQKASPFVSETMTFLCLKTVRSSQSQLFPSRKPTGLKEA